MPFQKSIYLPIEAQTLFHRSSFCRRHDQLTRDTTQSGQSRRSSELANPRDSPTTHGISRPSKLLQTTYFQLRTDCSTTLRLNQRYQNRAAQRLLESTKRRLQEGAHIYITEGQMGQRTTKGLRHAKMPTF